MSENDFVPSIDKDEIVTIQLHEKDLQALIQLLNITHETYTKIVASAYKQADDQSAVIFTARSKLAFAFSERLNKYLDFAEPISKELN